MGLFKKVRTPNKTPQELELERKQRKDIDQLTRETNSQLKSIKRGQSGRNTLLGSGGPRGIRDDGSGSVLQRRPGGSSGGGGRRGFGGGQGGGGGAGRGRGGILRSGQRR